MNDLFALMCFAGLILLAFIAVATMSRQGSLRRSTLPYGNPGSAVPRFDDPNISSGGSFGGSSIRPGIHPGGDAGRFDDPNIKSGGSFG